MQLVNVQQRSTAPTATDNCSGTITGTTSDALTRTTQGTSVVTWTFDDGHGNTTTQTQNIVVSDVTAPVAMQQLLQMQLVNVQQQFLQHQLQLITVQEQLPEQQVMH